MRVNVRIRLSCPSRRNWKLMRRQLATITRRAEPGNVDIVYGILLKFIRLHINGCERIPPEFPHIIGWG
jgi:hypothetical protein